MQARAVSFALATLTGTIIVLLDVCGLSLFNMVHQTSGTKKLSTLTLLIYQISLQRVLLISACHLGLFVLAATLAYTRLRGRVELMITTGGDEKSVVAKDGKTSSREQIAQA